MPKVELKFDLPDEEFDLQCAIKSVNLKLAINEIFDYLRGQIKYNEDNLGEIEISTMEKVRDKLSDILKDKHLEEIIYYN